MCESEKDPEITTDVLKILFPTKKDGKKRPATCTVCGKHLQDAKSSERRSHLANKHRNEVEAKIRELQRVEKKMVQNLKTIIIEFWYFSPMLTFFDALYK